MSIREILIIISNHDETKLLKVHPHNSTLYGKYKSVLCLLTYILKHTNTNTHTQTHFACAYEKYIIRTNNSQQG